MTTTTRAKTKKGLEAVGVVVVVVMECLNASAPLPYSRRMGVRVAVVVVMGFLVAGTRGRVTLTAREGVW